MTSINNVYHKQQQIDRPETKDAAVISFWCKVETLAHWNIL